MAITRTPSLRRLAVRDNGTVVSYEQPAAVAEEEVYTNARLDPKNYLHGPLSDNPSTRLRQMLARPGIVVAPGICDGISARCALEAGFDCLYQSTVGHNSRDNAKKIQIEH
ncbi:hypothetical protein FIBSPDRAFT_888704 [Athelia psychrophila]|uniref:Uncharacterized protein n=1 Tax=Athelia psychrophila TaxID=1759441 RepID=A0A166N2K0_9AGAM|nr:hypothetical protein FIBSPDRAFT_888704 [Fibularhizoctonia sp. CBS 109695]